MTSPKSSLQAPSVDPARIEAFYQELSGLHVELDGDPLALGPKRINAKTAECRAHLSRTERIFLEVSQDLHWYKREHRRALADFELAVQDLMSNDPEVRAGRNITDRQAVAYTKLRADRERISTLQFACEDLEAVLMVVRTKRNDLKDIASRLRDQLKICQEEISLGGRWGVRGRVKTNDKPDDRIKPSKSGMESVQAMMDDLIASKEEPEDTSDDLDDSEPVPPAEVPALQGSESPSAVDDILSEIGGQSTGEAPNRLPASSMSDTDMDAHLDGLGEHLPSEPEIMPTPSPDVDDLLDLF